MSENSTGDVVSRQAQTTAEAIRDPRPAGEILAAAALGQRERAEQLLAADPSLAHIQAPDGKTPLHLAAEWAQLDLVELLLRQGASASVTDAEGATPLHTMTGHCTRLEVARRLLASGADVNARDSAGNAPLFLAACLIHQAAFGWGAHDQLTDFFLQQGASLDAFTATILNRTTDLAAALNADPALLQARKRRGYIPDGSTLLHFAADRGHLAAAQLLVERGADVNALDGRGRPPLYVAGHEAGARKPGPTPAVVELLLANGAPLDVFACALLGRIEPLARLLEHEPRLSTARDAAGNTPLHLAAWNGKQPAAAELITRDASLEAQNGRHETPLDLAVRYGHTALAGDLLAHGVSCSLFTAIALARVDLVLARLRADPSASTTANRYGRTSLGAATEAAFWPATTGRPEAAAASAEIVRLLLREGAAPEIWAAALLNQPDEVVRLLGENPALVNAQDNGNTPLHYAASLGQVEAAAALLDHGAALEAREYSSSTSLRRAAGFAPGMGRGHPGTVALLAGRGANIDARDNWNDTPFDAALSAPAVAEVLLAHGAKLTVWAAAALDRVDELDQFLTKEPQQVNAPGPFGFTPLNWAAANGQLAAMRLLLARGADPSLRAWDRSPLRWAIDSGHREAAELLRQHGVLEG